MNSIGEKKMNNRKCKLLLVLIALIMTVQLCGFSFVQPNIAIDTDKYPVYTYVTADDLINELNRDKSLSKYKDKYIVLSGMFENRSKDGINVINSESVTIPCSYKKDAGISSDGFSFKDKIAVWGKCTVTFGKLKLTEVKKIVKDPAVRSSETYYTLNGSFLEKSRALERTLNGGTVKYYIPSGWKAVERNIKGQDLGKIDGYQYVLNNLPGNNSGVPESLFVCYFDKSLLLNSSDMTRTNQVEKAIIKNIEGSVGTFPIYKKTTYYGAKYQYYHGVYNDPLMEKYSTEYVFQADGDRGIVMYLYLYRETEANHLSDVMLITRLLEIN